MTRRFPVLRAVTFALATTFALAAAPAVASASGPAAQAQIKPKTRYVRPSVRKPPRTRIKGSVKTWDVRLRSTGNVARDPYLIEATGLNHGDKIRVDLQERSADLELPTAYDGQGLTSKQIGRLMQRSVAKALRFRELTSETAVSAGPAQTVAIEKPATLEPHTPVVISTTDRFGRKSNKSVSNVKGIPAEEKYIGNNQYEVKGSNAIAAYQAWTNLNNVFVTQAYEPITGSAATPRVKLLGLAAFPIGAKVTIVNEAMENQGVAGHTIVIDRTSNSGTASAELAAFGDDRLRLEVEFAAVSGQAQGSKVTHHIRVPTAHGKPAVARGDVRYFRAVQD